MHTLDLGTRPNLAKKKNILNKTLTVGNSICELVYILYVCFESDLSVLWTCLELGRETDPNPPVYFAAEQVSQTGWRSPAPAGSLAFESLSPSDPARLDTQVHRRTVGDKDRQKTDNND